VGAITPVAEIARAILLPAWPINLKATLIGADCGHYAPHYVARLRDETLSLLMRRPHRIALGPQGPGACDNPALERMWNWPAPSRENRRRQVPVRLGP
jgi:hypothetical protein